MDWKGREQSQNVEDRRGSRGGGGGGKTPGILGIIVVLVGAYYGVDLKRGQCPFRQTRIAGRLFRRYLGTLRRQQQYLQSRRHSKSHAGRRIRRRRPLAETGSGLCRSRQLYPWLVRRTHDLAQARFGKRRHQPVQHFQQLIRPSNTVL